MPFARISLLVKSCRKYVAFIKDWEQRKARPKLVPKQIIRPKGQPHLQRRKLNKIL
jgi:hypothetical protein